MSDDADRVRSAVCKAFIYVLGPIAGSKIPASMIADRVAEQLTAPPPGHVCPVPYGLGPEDLELLQWLTQSSVLGGMHKIRAVLDKILAAHRAPGDASEPLS